MSRDQEAAQPGHTISVGISDQDGFTTTDPRIRRRLLQQVADAGLNHVNDGRPRELSRGARASTA